MDVAGCATLWPPGARPRPVPRAAPPTGFLTWRTSAPTPAQDCATVQPHACAAQHPAPDWHHRHDAPSPRAEPAVSEYVAPANRRGSWE